MRKIILASTSPRRKELFAKLGFAFEAVAPNYEEDMTLPYAPEKLAKFLSLGKATSLAKKYKNTIIVAADSIVVYKNEVLGKPHTVVRAKQMLKKLSGTKNQIITGLTVIDTKNNKKISTATIVDVYIKKLTEQEIDSYIKTGEPLDKAGAYAIQGRGAIYIKKIEGDFFGAMGLPLFELAKTLKKFGLEVK